MDEAFSLLQEMRAQGLVPNGIIYSALINACGRAGQLARAFQTLDEMYRAGIEPNVVTWTTLIDACGKGKVLLVSEPVPPRCAVLYVQTSVFPYIQMNSLSYY